VNEFFLLLNVCHDCYPVMDNLDRRYHGDSPDDIALLNAANKLGYSYISPAQGHKTIEVVGVRQTIQILNFFHFRAERPRVSTIVRHKGQIKLFLKGSDKFILERLAKDRRHPQPYAENLEAYLRVFSKKGLRCICMAMRILSEEEYYELQKSISAAKQAPNYREILNSILDTTEKNLTLIGCTATQDCIDDQTISQILDFKKAGKFLLYKIS
jgi:magnesium-transporting ATPase (P-type)